MVCAGTQRFVRPLGHQGFGGSIGFADPGCDLSFAYVMNQMAADQGLAPKGQKLVDAVYRAHHGTAPPDRALQPTTPLLPPGTRLFLADGDHVGYRFDRHGGVVGSRRVTLSAASGADTAKRQAIPYRSGSWFYVTTGGLAGHWVAESSRAYLDPQVRPTWPELDPTLAVTFAAGTHTGFRFD